MVVIANESCCIPLDALNWIRSRSQMAGLFFYREQTLTNYARSLSMAGHYLKCLCMKPSDWFGFLVTWATWEAQPNSLATHTPHSLIILRTFPPSWYRWVIYLPLYNVHHLTFTSIATHVAPSHHVQKSDCNALWSSFYCQEVCILGCSRSGDKSFLGSAFVRLKDVGRLTF